MTPAGSWTTVYGFAAIELLVMLVACFNFMNLATAPRHAAGPRDQLAQMHGRQPPAVSWSSNSWSESVLFALVALVFALALGGNPAPQLQQLCPARPSRLGTWRTGLWSRPSFLSPFSPAFSAGFITALVLSGFGPVSILRANTTKLSGSGLFPAIGRWSCCSSRSPSAWALRSSSSFAQISFAPRGWMLDTAKTVLS